MGRPVRADEIAAAAAAGHGDGAARSRSRACGGTHDAVPSGTCTEWYRGDSESGSRCEPGCTWKRRRSSGHRRRRRALVSTTGGIPGGGRARGPFTGGRGMSPSAARARSRVLTRRSAPTAAAPCRSSDSGGEPERRLVDEGDRRLAGAQLPRRGHAHPGERAATRVRCPRTGITQWPAEWPPPSPPPPHPAGVLPGDAGEFGRHCGGREPASVRTNDPSAQWLPGRGRHCGDQVIRRSAHGVKQVLQK